MKKLSQALNILFILLLIFISSIVSYKENKFEDEFQIPLKYISPNS